VFNKRKAIQADVADLIDKTFAAKADEFDHIALCGCGRSKEKILDLLHPNILSKVVVLNVSYTGKPAWKEALQLVRTNDVFQMNRQSHEYASKWISDVLDPYEVTALSGQTECLQALRGRMVRVMLLSDPSPPSLDGSDLEAFLTAECETLGVDLIRIQINDNTSNMFNEFGGIGAWLYDGFTEDDVLKMDAEEELEEEVEPADFESSDESVNETHAIATRGSVGKRKTKQNVNLVFCGHVDAGKSTTVGHLLVKANAIDERLVADKGACRFAHLLDVDQEERERGVTIECGFHSFETKKRQYTIIDAPGHRSFLVNFISGANQADVAILLLSARAREFEDGFHGGQTKEHCVLIRGFDIRQVILAVNKMDECGWNETRYNEIVTTTKEYLVNTLKFDEKNISHVPISGKDGLNLTQEDIACPFSPGSLLKRLKACSKKIKAPKIQDFRMSISDYERVGNKIRVQGKVESGILMKNQKVIIMPENLEAEVMDVSICPAYPGDLVSIFLRGCSETDFQVGSIICDIGNPTKPVRKVTAMIQLCKDEIVLKGYRAVFHAHNLVEEFTVSEVRKIHHKKCSSPNCRSSSCGLVHALQSEGEWGEVVLSFDHSIAVEAYSEWKRLGAFVLRKDEATIALGRVLN